MRRSEAKRSWGLLKMAIAVAAVGVPELLLESLAARLESFGYRLQQIGSPNDRFDESCLDHLAVVAVQGSSDLTDLRDFASSGVQWTMLALVESMSPGLVFDCCLAGAAGFACMDWSAEEFVQALEAARRGLAVIPIELVSFTSFHLAERTRWVHLVGPERMTWLKALAHGVSTADLAYASGYSEREMYRKLRTLYEDMGVTSRTQALLLAAKAGILGNAEFAGLPLAPSRPRTVMVAPQGVQDTGDVAVTEEGLQGQPRLRIG